MPGWDEAADLDKHPAGDPGPCQTPVPEDLRREIEAHMEKYPDRHSAAIPALAAAQRVHGWCSPEAIEQAACVMRVTPAYLESVATFYDMLSTEAPLPVEHHEVYVCTNISCSLHGADAIFTAMLEAAHGDPALDVRSFECLGGCELAPMASVDGAYVGPLEAPDVEEILDAVRENRPVLPDKQLANRPCADPAAAEWPPRKGKGKAKSPGP